MKRLVLLLAAVSVPAFAVVTGGPSAQNFGMTGLGPNAAGQARAQ